MIVNCFAHTVTILTVEGFRETYDPGNADFICKVETRFDQFLGFRMVLPAVRIDLPAQQYGIVYLMPEAQAHACWANGRHDAVHPYDGRWRRISDDDRRFRYVIEGGLVFSPQSPYSGPVEPEEEAEA